MGHGEGVGRREAFVSALPFRGCQTRHGSIVRYALIASSVSYPRSRALQLLLFPLARLRRAAYLADKLHSVFARKDARLEERQPLVPSACWRTAKNKSARRLARAPCCPDVGNSDSAHLQMVEITFSPLRAAALKLEPDLRPIMVKKGWDSNSRDNGKMVILEKASALGRAMALAFRDTRRV